MASVAVPPVWVASKSMVAPLSPGVPASWVWCGAAALAAAAAVAAVVETVVVAAVGIATGAAGVCCEGPAAASVGAGCEATRSPLTRPLAW